jgi:dihydroflavonol-4-reductase
MTPLILGAAGFIGLNLFDALAGRGVRARCGRRRRTNVLPLRSRKADMVMVELDEPSSLEAAMDGVELVFHAAGHYPRFSLNPEEALRTGRRQMKNVLDAAAGAGVRRVVYVSTTATVAPSEGGASDESHVYDSSPGIGSYHDLKWEMERIAASEDRLQVVTACPAGCLGPWDLRFGTSALLVAVAHGMKPAHPDGVVNLVDARDVGAGLAALGTMDSPPRRVILSAHNERLHDLLVRVSRRYGAPEPPRPMRDEEAIRFADDEERSAAAGGIRARLSREIADLVVHGVPVDGGLSERELGLSYRPLPDTLDAFDEWARRMRIIPPLSNTALPSGNAAR